MNNFGKTIDKKNFTIVGRLTYQSMTDEYYAENNFITIVISKKKDMKLLPNVYKCENLEKSL